MRSPLDRDWRFHYWSEVGRLNSDDHDAGAIGVGDTMAEALEALWLKLHEGKK